MQHLFCTGARGSVAATSIQAEAGPRATHGASGYRPSQAPTDLGRGPSQASLPLAERFWWTISVRHPAGDVLVEKDHLR